MYRYLTVYDGRYIVRNLELDISERLTLLAVEQHAGTFPFADLNLYGQHVTIWVQKTVERWPHNVGEGSLRWTAYIDGEAADYSGRCGATRDKAVANLIKGLAHRVEVADLMGKHAEDPLAHTGKL